MVDKNQNPSASPMFRMPRLGVSMAEMRQALRQSFDHWLKRLQEQSPSLPDELSLHFADAGQTEEEVSLRLYTDSGEWAATLRLGSGRPLADARSMLQALAFSLLDACRLDVMRRQQVELEARRCQAEKEAKRHEMLFLATKKLHDKIDVDSVLQEVLLIMNSIYPHAEVELLLSQDSPTTLDSVKLLSFDDPGSDICVQAFMDGRFIYNTTPEASGAPRIEMAAPLTGKQGVYGILHLVAADDRFDSTDLQFVSMLADIAGNAFENAKLYEQSNLLITELRLINEITKRLNQSLSLNEIFTFASTELCKIFRADCCCILQVDPEKRQFIVRASTLPALFHEEYPIDQGYSGIVFAANEAVIVSDYEEGRKVRSRLMDMTSCRSLMSAPITVKDQVIGIVHVTHSEPNGFSYENYKLLQVLSVHIGLAMSNASLHAEVQRMVITDRLTSLYVRHYLDEQVNILQKKDFCGSLILVDIDHFKRVNDTYGHQVGDKILIAVSHIIRTSIRDSDIAARWGGEELAIYLPQVACGQAERIAERIRQRVQGETGPQVTVSCGVSDWNWEDEKITVESLVYRADMALYEAKNGGRNQVKLG